MSKNYQKAAIRRIFALAVLIAGTCYIAATAWATTCFLPSGNCSTGRVGNEDKPNPNPDPTPGPDTPEDACKDFTNNTTQTEYNRKNTTSCFKCTTCTSNGNTKYNCVKNSGYSWDSSDGGHCCVSGEKWYSKMGTCCSATSGCTCPTLKKWSNGECVCQYAKTSTGTCCEKDKIANKHLCCNAGEHAENTICCPANKHEEGGECKCDENYIPDGTGCKPIDKCKGYDLTASQAAQYNNNCYVCSQCGSNTAKYKCEVRTTPLNGYKLDNGTCKKDCNIAVTCKEIRPIGERSDIDNATIDSAINIRYNGTISNYNDVKSYLDKLNLVIKTKLACVQGDSNIVKSGQYYEMTRIPFSNAASSNFSGAYKLYYPLYKDKLNCGSNHTSYEGTTYELDNQTGCTLSSSTTTKNTCATWDLKTETEANCGAGEIFQQDTTHKTDDNGDKCGTCVKTTPSTVKFTFHNICGKKDKIVNRVAWLKNGKLQYETLGNGIPTEVPYSDEYVVLSSTDNGYVYMISAGNIKAGNECGVTNSEQGSDYHKCYVTTGIQYNVGMFSGSINSDNWLFNSLPVDSHTMPYFSGYGLYLHLYSATPGKFYQVYTYCASTCGSYNQECYYGVGGLVKDRYECNTCQKSSGSSSGSSGGNGNPFH